MKKYCFIRILPLIALIVSCGVNNPKENVNEEYFLGTWKSNHILERIEFNKTNVKWFINYKKDTSITFNTDLIDSSLYDSYDSNYLEMYYKGWNLDVNENKIDFLDTFAISSGKFAHVKSTMNYSIVSKNSFYFNGINSDSVLFVRN
jgi:hypothetical protein